MIENAFRRKAESLFVTFYCITGNVLLFLRHNYAIIMLNIERGELMPVIMPIKDLRNTSEISDLAHKYQEPIFITKNGYSDLVVMSSELYDKFARINRIDQAIFDAEKELEESGVSIDLDEAFERLEGKYYE